jgi:hypothetical protein
MLQRDGVDGSNGKRKAGRGIEGFFICAIGNVHAFGFNSSVPAGFLDDVPTGRDRSASVKLD